MPDTKTKADIIEAIQKENGYSRKQSFEAIEILMEIIKQSFECGEDVMIPGFEKFQVKYKRQRRGLLYLTWNLPKPDIRTSSPDSRDCLMVSNKISMTSADCFHE